EAVVGRALRHAGHVGGGRSLDQPDRCRVRLRGHHDLRRRARRPVWLTLQNVIPPRYPPAGAAPSPDAPCQGVAGLTGLIHLGRRPSATSLPITIRSQKIAPGIDPSAARNRDLPRRGGQAAARGKIMPEPVRTGQRYIPGLDGLRALAVLAVIAFHEQLGW